jgi:hypothetical protein
MCSPINNKNKKIMEALKNLTLKETIRFKNYHSKLAKGQGVYDWDDLIDLRKKWLLGRNLNTNDYILNDRCVKKKNSKTGSFACYSWN